MFQKVIKLINDFLENTPDDIYAFSVLLEDLLVDEYDKMYDEQPEATMILADEIPDICASAEPGMTKEEIEEFKRRLKKEYDKATKVVA